MEVKQILLIVGVTFLFTALFIPFVKKMANYLGAMDLPNERKIHKVPIPRLGGLGIYMGFLLGYMLFGEHSIQMNSILIGSFIIIITGIIDDIKPIQARYKLIGQLVAASIIPIYGGIVLQDVSVFDLYIDFGILAIPITILFITAVINCINLIDGLDGLAGGLASIYFLTIGIIAVLMGNTNNLELVLTFVMLGSTLGFLIHNFNPAKIFMGDSGSMFLGYIIAVISLLGFKNVTLTSFIIPVILLAIPILDTLFAIIRRILKHQPISMPDKNHLHHQLLKLKFSQKKTVLIIYLVDLLFAATSIFYVLGDFRYGLVIYAILFILTVILIFKTDIIREKKHK